MDQSEVCYEAAIQVGQKFYQADTARNKSQEYGMGLSPVQEIVRQHQGALEWCRNHVRELNS